MWSTATRPISAPRCLGSGPQHLRCRAEQDGVDRLLVLKGDLGHRSRQGEHDVEVGYRQQLGLSCRKPLGPRRSLALRAMPVAAGVVGALHEAALGAGLGMSAERWPSGTARWRSSRAARCGRDDHRGCAGRRRRGGGRRPPLPGRPTTGSQVRRAARPPASAGRAGSGSAGSARSRPAYSARSSTGCCVRAAPG